MERSWSPSSRSPSTCRCRRGRVRPCARPCARSSTPWVTGSHSASWRTWAWSSGRCSRQRAGDLLVAGWRVRLMACPSPRRRTRSPCGCRPSPTTESSGGSRPRSPLPAAWSPRSTWSSRPGAAGPSTSPARRATASTPTRSSTPSTTVDGVDGAQGQRPDVPAAPRRQDRDPVRRCRCGTATTCRWPTPRASRGSAWHCAKNPEDAPRLTIKGNTVAVVTDGSAVLGLGNIGPAAALPVMEGKAALFKRFADIDAWPICLDTQDVDEIVGPCELIAPGFGGINLEDIAAPRCFEIERRLRELLDIPVFHDDQHGTAIVVLAALTNALRVVGKTADRRPRSSCPAAGRPASAIVTLLLAAGRRRHRGRATARASCARGDGRADPTAAADSPSDTNPRTVHRHPARGARRRRRLHRGHRARRPAQPEWIATMADAARSSSRWPTRTPRSTPPRPRKHAAVVATGPLATTRTRSTTCSRSPACSAGCSTRGPTTSPIEMLLARGRRDRARRHRRGAQPELHHPDRLRPRGPEGGRRGHPRRRRRLMRRAFTAVAVAAARCWCGGDEPESTPTSETQ